MLGGEVPTAKLSALHKVLQSDFLKAVKEVYEHVYETVEMGGSPDVRASATAKATIAAFAASEGHAHPRVVELPKTDEGLGFNVMGGEHPFLWMSYKKCFQNSMKPFSSSCIFRKGTKLPNLYIKNHSWRCG